MDVLSLPRTITLLGGKRRKALVDLSRSDDLVTDLEDFGDCLLLGTSNVGVSPGCRSSGSS